MAGISISTDFAILILPIPILAKLNVSRNRRCECVFAARVSSC